jgi:hypothetical protein
MNLVNTLNDGKWFIVFGSIMGALTGVFILTPTAAPIG